MLSSSKKTRALGRVLPVVGLSLVLLGIGLASPSARAAAKLSVTDDTFINLDLLLQPWVQFTYQKDSMYPATKGANAKPAAEAPDGQTDFFLRRTRIILGGQITKWVSFFMETDMPNLGKGGVWAGVDYNGDGITDVSPATFFVQDAWVKFNINPAFNIYAGMLITPFNRNFFTSAAKLHGLDYHVVLAKYPNGSNLVWRDNGVMATGLLLNNKLEYRLAVTEGVAKNNDDGPRVTGRVAYSLLDAEGDFFPGGTYLGTKKVLSVGAAVDFQNDAIYNADGTHGKYLGLTGDVFWDLPMGPNRLSGLLGVVYYGGDQNPNKGVGVLFDVGYALGKWEPIVAVDWFMPDKRADGFDGQLLHLHPGLNYWLNGYAANIKLDFGLLKNNAPKGATSGPNWVIQPTIQTQLFF